ncbi:DNA topoisomerase (ATP-hydrolyzing) subunit A [Treponema phagedenis]|uniref:DNA gyrase subunit A n=1 Tax=Treponema phagedenis TaxID=162 RepID=A0AAE6ISP7_TREPH|nr:DNA topoisomerase (ATP-hydrolyzing) subunit A [Treponema phagedenis]EFW39069.1 DNA gyrase, A subunit [Treponema phagedenis F0421]NVP23884.1 DNA topoisomerase (ATP-hydrolyzing) subunit A [Treponema phagedenis]QEJ96552.1 DNA topoisomerase (ATP-hydrolyzing) subunit A [Treponema phagedenis]QEJ99721.1 DNA topoisomerase (ATP-hydrolyzing) subunit A [Treponema phagedenis]QEK02339.1 DNA topoisomerase (ATP-hydrolyzing) subunit A [Treponema phagedenis]
MEEITTPEGGILIPIPIETEVKRAYIDYSMSVIVSRALPDVRDGLKPVHRRILYSMEEKGLRYSGPTRKCAKIVGDVLGSYHPHGDASVYDALVRLGQDFSLRYPVIHPQGNFGTIGGDPAAAYRYTEAKMAKIAESMVEDIKKETVDFISNFDDSTKEPTVLPAKFPFLLANGSSGIAVGMATNMPPHNLREIASAISAYIDNPEITIDELCKHIKGPDFPTGGTIFGKKGIRQAYKTGRGKILVRGRFTIEVDKKGKETIIFTEVPYQVNTTNLVTRIGELARNKVIDGIANVNDETSDRTGLRIVIELKRGAITKVVLNQLFAKTALQSSFGVINLALVEGRPQTLTLKDLVRCFVNHRIEVVTRRTRFDLRKAEERAHILRALIVAIDNIDEVIAIIRSSADTPTAKLNLMKRFGFDEVQSQAIVDMQLKRLTNLEIKDLRKELEELEILIAHLKDLLEHPEKIRALVKDETNEIADKFGDERRTDIVADEVEELNIEDLIQKEEMVILISNLGYIKRIPVSAYKSQNRGGKGSNSANLAEDDFIDQIFTASTHDYIMFITNEGKAYWLKVHEIPEASRTSRGSHIKSLLSVSGDEEITAVVSLKEFSDSTYLLMATAAGVVKKVTTDNFQNAKTRGIIAIKLDDGDKLVSAILTTGKDEIMLITRHAQALRMTEEEIRPLGRASRGVAGIKLAQGDELTGALRVADNQKMLIMTENGYGKRVEFSEFTPHGRATGGQRIYTLSEKTGEVVGLLTVLDDDEVVCITGQGKTIRVNVDSISIMGRSAQGVRVLDIESPDILIGLDVVARETNEEIGQTSSEKAINTELDLDGSDS